MRKIAGRIAAASLTVAVLMAENQHKAPSFCRPKFLMAAHR
jgi:hypothetical protein